MTDEDREFVGESCPDCGRALVESMESEGPCKTCSKLALVLLKERLRTPNRVCERCGGLLCHFPRSGEFCRDCIERALDEYPEANCLHLFVCCLIAVFAMVAAFIAIDSYTQVKKSAEVLSLLAIGVILSALVASQWSMIKRGRCPFCLTWTMESYSGLRGRCRHCNFDTGAALEKAQD